MGYKQVDKQFAGLGRVTVNCDKDGVSLYFRRRVSGTSGEIFVGSMKLDNIADAEKLIKALWKCVAEAKAGQALAEQAPPKEIKSSDPSLSAMRSGD